MGIKYCIKLEEQKAKRRGFLAEKNVMYLRANPSLNTPNKKITVKSQQTKNLNGFKKIRLQLTPKE